MKILSLLKATFKDWREDNAMRLSAALSYYSVFSLGPLLLIAISIAGFLFGEKAASGAIESQLTGAIGSDAAIAVQEMIAGAANSADGLLMTIVGVVVLLFTSSGVFAQLQDALNTIWEIKKKPGLGIWATLKARFLSFSMVLVIGFLLLLSLVLSAAMTGATDFLGGFLPFPGLIGPAISFAVSLSLVTLLFAFIFKVLPDADVEWRDVWWGALATSLLFGIGKFALGLYLGRQDTASTYGAAGAFILVLIWIYYTTNILLFGAEMTQVHAKMKGRRITPDETAVPIDADEAEIKRLEEESKATAPPPPELT